MSTRPTPPHRFSAKVIADSVSEVSRITTLEVTFPRFILAELNTHGMLARNSASSRAIPVKKQIERVTECPFFPAEWTEKKPGMQGGDPISDMAARLADLAWNDAASTAISTAERLDSLDVHKQYANRVLEPFAWHTAVVTATEWGNFFGLRVSPLAQPEFNRLASMMSEAMDASVPIQLTSGEWHLPYVIDRELKVVDGAVRRVDCDDDTPHNEQEIDWFKWANVSSARCARLSYLTQDGRHSVEEDLALFGRLYSSGHMSPLEHPARALSPAQWSAFANQAAQDWICNRVPVGKLWGWAQFRKQHADEHDFSRRPTP